MNADSWLDSREVLCVRLDTIGDVLMTTPAIRALKDSSPGRRITLLTSSVAAPVIDVVPEIDEVLAYDAPWMKASVTRADSSPDRRFLAELRDRRFDAAVVFTVYSQNPLPSAMACYLADVPLRLAHCRENPYQLLTHWACDTEPESGVRHEVRRQLDLVGTVGAQTENERLSFHVAPGSEERVDDLLGRSRPGPMVVVHPGVSAASRRYPAERFGQAAEMIAEATGARIVFTGVEEEVGFVERARRAMRRPSLSLAGRLSLGDLGALISRADVLVTNNTGPAHVAAAVGTPVVDVYALTNRQHTPWMVPNRVLFHDVPCRDCLSSRCREGHHLCLRGVAASTVSAAAIELMTAEAALTVAEDAACSLYWRER